MRSVMLMATYECQLRCGYCQIDRGPRSMDEGMARRGADFLLSSRADRLVLNFFGGEPLLAWDLVRRTALYADARRGGRSLRVNLTTNGLLLDQEKLDFLRGLDSHVHLSLDGDAHANAARLLGTGTGAQAAMEAALRRLDASGVAYHVNAVADPERADTFDLALLSLEALGARRIQFGYRVGVPWSTAAVAALLAALDRYEAVGRAEFVNRFSDSEPVMLKNEILVDIDGSLYWDGAVFLEATLPKVRQALRLGSLDDGLDVDALEPSADESLKRLMTAYPPGADGSRILLNNIKLGLALQRRWPGRAQTATGANR
jgi:hypothetical protein